MTTQPPDLKKLREVRARMDVLFPEEVTVDDLNAWTDAFDSLLDAYEASARDAERYRWLRRKFCFAGNGDGTASMHAINLPDSSYFPEMDVEDAVDQAIDAARHATQGD